jgi:hypothetical protein
MSLRPVHGDLRIEKYADVDRGISNPGRRVEIRVRVSMGGPGRGRLVMGMTALVAV